MKYLAQVTLLSTGTNQGCYCFNSDSLDEIRNWAKRVGKAGDELTIMRNGGKLEDSRKFVL